MASLRCRICGRTFEPHQTPAMPFCGHRCREIDLGRWLAEKYAVPEPDHQNADRGDEAGADQSPAPENGSPGAPREQGTQ